MPVPWELIAASVIANASLVAGDRQNKKNIEAQKWQNFQDRVYQDKMTAWQAMQAQKDLQAQNAYNSPLQQMNRLRQAGLSPMLVYGKGANTAGDMARGVQPSNFKQEAPKTDNRFVAPALNGFLQNMQIQAQTDNLHQQGSLMIKEGLLKEAQIAKIGIETAQGQFDLQKAHATYDDTLKKIKLENATLEQNLSINFDRNEREEIANSANVALTIQKLVTEKLSQGKTTAETNQIKEVINNIKLDAQLKQLDIDLRKNGIMPHDPLYARLVSKFLDSIDWGTWGTSGKDAYRKKYGGQHMDTMDIVP